MRTHYTFCFASSQTVLSCDLMPGRLISKITASQDEADNYLRSKGISPLLSACKYVYSLELSSQRGEGSSKRSRYRLKGNGPRRAPGEDCGVNCIGRSFSLAGHFCRSRIRVIKLLPQTRLSPPSTGEAIKDNYVYIEHGDEAAPSPGHKRRALPLKTKTLMLTSVLYLHRSSCAQSSQENTHKSAERIEKETGDNCSGSS